MFGLRPEASGGATSIGGPQEPIGEDANRRRDAGKSLADRSAGVTLAFRNRIAKDEQCTGKCLRNAAVEHVRPDLTPEPIPLANQTLRVG